MTVTAARLEYEIGAQALKELLDGAPDAVVILDIRDRAAYLDAHLPNALSAPLDELDETAADLPAGKTLVTYCGGGECGQALRAALDLAQRGHRVRHLQGGMKEWTRRGFTVVTASQAW